MKTTLRLLPLLFATILLMNCGGKEEKKKAGFSYEKQETTVKKEVKKETSVPASQQIALSDKGVGPITSLELPAEIDQTMAANGKEIYKKMCTACHRPNKKFIGPAPKGIFDRRSPEWIMNMILNPENMIKNNQLAEDLLKEFNGAPMANQNLTQEEARAVLEYFRTL